MFTGFFEEAPMPFHPSPADVARATGCAPADCQQAVPALLAALAWKGLDDRPTTIAALATFF